LAAAAGKEPGAVAFVYPRRTNIACSVAVLSALTWVTDDFPTAVEHFRERGLALGQRVAVQPSGHVYEYDGPFEDGNRRFAVPGLRLRILNARKSDWRRTVISEPAVRRFPTDQIARLKPTDRVAPRGQQNTSLGDWKASYLDGLTGIRTGGNTGLLRNRVLTLSTHVDVDHFFETVTLLRQGSDAACVADVLTSGRITEDGMLHSDDRYQSEDEPLVAVTHSVERLADACDYAEPCSKSVFVDGAAALVRNFQAFDRIAARQRLILITDHEDDEYITDLASRGCCVWHLTEAEMSFGLTDSKEGCEGVFSEAKRASAVASKTHVEAVPADDRLVDDAAAELARASRALGGETDESISKPVGQAFGALLELASWFGAPAPPEVAAYLERLRSILAEAERVAPWTPPNAADALRNAVRYMTQAASEPLVGWSKLEALVFTLDALQGSSRRVGIATRSAPAAAALREHLPEYLRSIQVFGAALVPADLRLDTVIVASWLKSEAMSRLFNLYLAPDVKVIAVPFERKWLAGLVRRRQSGPRYGQLDRSMKASILGVIEVADVLGSAPSIEASGDTTAPGETPRDSSALTEQLARMENWTKRASKGRPADPADEHDARDARYVGFVGHTYAYVTAGRALPVVTDVVRGLSVKQAKVPLMTIDRLRAGEYVLFRDQGERDVISLFAEQELGSTRYKERRAVADRWKTALNSLGSSHFEISHRLRETGVSKHSATIRSWVLDADKIGPGSRADIDAIARAAGESSSWASAVWEAIAEIRGAHIAAGQRLSQFLLSELPKQLRTFGETETHVDLTLVQAWVVEIEEIGEVESRSYTEVNRLLWA
jgi:hypothetical protein